MKLDPTEVGALRQSRRPFSRHEPRRSRRPNSEDLAPLAPDNAAAHHALGLALVRRKNYPEALDHLAKANTLAPDDARFAYVYGVALKSLGNPEQSRAVLQGALQRHPWDAALLNAPLSDALQSGDAAAGAPGQTPVEPAARRSESRPPRRQTRGTMNRRTRSLERNRPPVRFNPQTQQLERPMPSLEKALAALDADRGRVALALEQLGERVERFGAVTSASAKFGAPIGMTMNSWKSTEFSACLPPLTMFIIGAGSWFAPAPPR